MFREQPGRASRLGVCRWGLAHLQVRSGKLLFRELLLPGKEGEPHPCTGLSIRQAKMSVAGTPVRRGD